MDRKPVTVRSYANIAIIKYWGKKKEKEMVPATSSISLTLENMYTETTLSPLPALATADAFYINGSTSAHGQCRRFGTTELWLIRKSHKTYYKPEDVMAIVAVVEDRKKDMRFHKRTG